MQPGEMTEGGLFIELVENTVMRFGLLPEGAGALVGLSGGADSVALLTALKMLAPSHGWRIAAAHFNHRIRGEAADRDEAFCAELCENNGLPFYCASEDIPAIAEAEGISVETAGRLRRYAFLEQTRESLGLDAIAVAHHMDDNAESVLMHLLRGSGLAGLTGIKPKRGNIIRPLLNVRRSQIESFLDEMGILFCTDETNLLPDGTRNRIRLDVIPYLERHVNSALVPTLCSAAELLSQDEEYLSGIAADALETARSGDGYLRKKLDALPAPVKTRALRMALAEAGAEVDIERVHIDAVAELLRGRTGTGLDLPHARVYNSYELVVFKGAEGRADSFETELITEGVTETPFGRFTAETVSGRAGFFKSSETGFLDLDKISLPLTVRTRRSGDRFYPVGAPGRRKLKDYFIDKKVDRRLRDSTPIVACGDEALFIPGFGIAEPVKVTEETRRMLRIEFTKNNSEG